MRRSPKDWPRGVKVAAAVAVVVFVAALLSWAQSGGQDDLLETVTRDAAGPTTTVAGQPSPVAGETGESGGAASGTAGSPGQAPASGTAGVAGSAGVGATPEPPPSAVGGGAPSATGPGAATPTTLGGSGGGAGGGGQSPGTTAGAPASTVPPAASGETLPPDVISTICGLVRAAGAAPIRRGTEAYSPALDPDGNGLACE